MPKFEELKEFLTIAKVNKTEEDVYIQDTESRPRTRLVVSANLDSHYLIRDRLQKFYLLIDYDGKIVRKYETQDGEVLDPKGNKVELVISDNKLYDMEFVESGFAPLWFSSDLE
jgi:hypothetical protein